MGCVALVRCVLVLRCGLAGVVWCGIRMQASAYIQIPHHYQDDARSNKHNNKVYLREDQYTFYISLISSYNEKCFRQKCRENRNIFYVQ